MRGSISEAIPKPLSFTRIATSSPILSVLSKIFPPLGVYLAALFSKLATTWRQSSRVAVDVQSLPCLRHRKFMALCMNKRLGGLNGVRDDRSSTPPVAASTPSCLG